MIGIGKRTVGGELYNERTKHVPNVSPIRRIRAIAIFVSSLKIYVLVKAVALFRELRIVCDN